MPPASPPARGTYRKASARVPRGYFAWEAAGLRWLAGAQAGGGARVVPVVDVGEDHLDLERLTPAPPTRAGAQAFGAALARTHAAGAAAYGIGPDGWSGDGFLGPLSDPLPLPLAPAGTWAEHVAINLVGPMVRRGRDSGTFGAAEGAVFERFLDGLGRHDVGEAPARLHGDLWSGNLLWTASGAVLIDPAAHGGSREADLAMLALFGAPQLERVLAAYDEVWPLAAGWRERVLLHQVHPLVVHAVLFGGGYAAQALCAARRYA